LEPVPLLFAGDFSKEAELRGIAGPWSFSAVLTLLWFSVALSSLVEWCEWIDSRFSGGWIQWRFIELRVFLCWYKLVRFWLWIFLGWFRRIAGPPMGGPSMVAVFIVGAFKIQGSPVGFVSFWQADFPRITVAGLLGLRGNEGCP
jgi:hypothetical protein